MKIIAEFNSVDEIKEFTEVFGGVNLTKVAAPKEVKKKAVSKKKQEEPKVEQTEAEIDETPTETVKEKQEEVKITKEDVQNACKSKIKAGKTAEIKAIIEAHGATNVSGIKEEEYEAVIAEVEAL